MVLGDDSAKYPDIEVFSELCFRKFSQLPKTGKPTTDVWTVLAGIIQHDVNTKANEVVALGLGTKCIGRSGLCPGGLILNDSHAEILARRSFLRYMYHEMRKSVTIPQQSIFLWDDEERSYHLRPGLTFHFFCTQVPCGDACILTPRQRTADEQAPLAKKAKIVEASIQRDSVLGETLQQSEEQIFTGAKLIGTSSDNEDSLLQMVGALRTKPGRGDRTLSMSCSDKLAKWNVLGVQGALIGALVSDPIYFETLNFCANTHDFKASIQRAIYNRWIHKSNVLKTDGKFTMHQPHIRTSTTINYEFSQNEHRQPSPNGLVWCKIDNELRPYEVSVKGKRQGVNIKKANSPEASLKCSKYYLLKEFVDLLRSAKDLQDKFKLQTNDLDNISYHRYKQLAEEYQVTWNILKRNYFGQWTEKPEGLKEFCLKKPNKVM